MSCAPRFLPFWVEGELRRDLCEFLSHELEPERFAVNALDVAVLFFHELFHLLLEVLAHDVHDLSESGLYGIIYRIIDDGFS